MTSGSGRSVPSRAPSRSASSSSLDGGAAISTGLSTGPTRSCTSPSADALRRRWPAWVLAPEATFSIYGERGAIDIIDWHPGRRAVLVIELKTDVVDLNELLGTLDRKRRLARKVASERGWEALSVGAWLIFSDSATNRRRAAAHRTMLQAALPDGRGAVPRWLRDPVGDVAARSFWSDSRGVGTRSRHRPIRRVRPGRASVDPGPTG
jgi:hypothetical protein